MNKYLRDIDIKSYIYPWEIWESESELQKYIFKVALVNEKPIGFSAFRFTTPKEISESKVGIMIAKLAVHPDYREVGAGSTLLEHVEKIAKQQNVDRLITVLHEDNKYRGFLIRRGFLAVGIENEIYPDSCDGYRFRKIL